jgi:hypothetical protein
MKYKGIILVFLVGIAIVGLILFPDEKIYQEVAEVGSPAPDFELKDSNGNLWQLSDRRYPRASPWNSDMMLEVSASEVGPFPSAFSP